MNVQYFKWETEKGTAYGKLLAGHRGTHFLGTTSSYLFSIAVNDPALVEITETEFTIWDNSFRYLRCG